jgi:hypothetical protein
LGVSAELRVPRSRARAQTVIEYGILIASIVFMVLLGVSAFGNQVQPWFAGLAGYIVTTGT